MQHIKVKQGQCIKDLAVEHCGTVEVVMQIALLNGVSVTDALVVDSLIQVPAVVNQKVVDYYKRENLQPASDLVNDYNPPGGIGYMNIGGNFIVS